MVTGMEEGHGAWNERTGAREGHAARIAVGCVETWGAEIHGFIIDNLGLGL